MGVSVRVHMLAFRDGDIRTVDIPDDELNRELSVDEMLSLVYKYGQNESQRRPLPSVSIGDVIEAGGHMWIVRPVGFSAMLPGELAEYRKIPRYDRAWSEYARPTGE